MACGHSAGRPPLVPKLADDIVTVREAITPLSTPTTREDARLALDRIEAAVEAASAVVDQDRSTSAGEAEFEDAVHRLWMRLKEGPEAAVTGQPVRHASAIIDDPDAGWNQGANRRIETAVTRAKKPVVPSDAEKEERQRFIVRAYEAREQWLKSEAYVGLLDVVAGALFAIHREALRAAVSGPVEIDDAMVDRARFAFAAFKPSHPTHFFAMQAALRAALSGDPE